jgi:hypothetical protein
MRAAGRRRSSRRDALLIGTGTAVIMVGVALAGADRPPPPGFVWVVAFGVVWGVGVWLLLPRALVCWDERGATAALFAAAVCGGSVGVLAVSLAGAVSGGEPSVQVDTLWRALALASGAVLGGAAGVGLILLARWLDRRRSEI